MIVIVQSIRRRRTDILYVGESSLDVGEQTVGETTRSRNDRLPHCLPFMHFEFIARYVSIPLTRKSKSIKMAANCKMVVDWVRSCWVRCCLLFCYIFSLSVIFRRGKWKRLVLNSFLHFFFSFFFSSLPIISNSINIFFKRTPISLSSIYKMKCIHIIVYFLSIDRFHKGFSRWFIESLIIQVTNCKSWVP